MNVEKLPTKSLLNFMDKLKEDYSDESISSGLDSLTLDELVSLRTLINKIDIHTYERVLNYDLNDFCQERKDTDRRYKAQRQFEDYALKQVGESECNM